MASGKRGKPSNNRSLRDVRDQVVALLRERYGDFGPTLAADSVSSFKSMAAESAFYFEATKAQQGALVARPVVTARRRRRA